MRESVIYQEIIQQGLEQGLEQGKQAEALSLILRLLTRQVGSITPEVEEQIQRLSLVQLENLGEALLDFEDVRDLVAWLGVVQRDRTS